MLIGQGGAARARHLTSRHASDGHAGAMDPHAMARTGVPMVARVPYAIKSSASAPRGPLAHGRADGQLGTDTCIP